MSWGARHAGTAVAGFCPSALSPRSGMAVDARGSCAVFGANVRRHIKIDREAGVFWTEIDGIAIVHHPPLRLFRYATVLFLLAPETSFPLLIGP